MKAIQILTIAAALAGLAACAPRNQGPEPGPDGQPLPVAYVITEREAAAIPDRVLGQVNMLRANSGLPPLALNQSLMAASLAHSRDMAAQNRAWHFGSDGSSPIDRVKRQGYFGQLIGEDISETYENDIMTLNNWMQNRDTRDIVMDPSAREMGIAWYQEPTKKVWWTILIGG